MDAHASLSFYDTLPIGIIGVHNHTGLIEYRNNYIRDIYGDVNTIKEIEDVDVEKMSKLSVILDNCTIYYTERDNQDLLKELIKNKHELSKEYTIKCMYISEISKKVKVPLNNISLLIDMLDREGSQTTRKTHIKLIKQCSSKLYQIINDSVDYTELLLGHVKLSNNIVNIKQTIDELNDMVQDSLRNKQVEFKTSIASNVPELINVDIERLKQILISLLSNAIKFTMRGKIQLNTSYINKDEWSVYMNKHANGLLCDNCGNMACVICNGLSCKYEKCKNCTCCNTPKNIDVLYLKFDIIDTGCGVKKEYMDIITRQNTSMSFVIIRNIVQLMNGVIWLDWTEENNGSKFSFIIELERLKIEEISSQIRSALRAMIITENKEMRINISNILLTNSIDPIITTSIDESYLFYSRVKIDLIICDLDPQSQEYNNIISFLQEKSNKLIIGIGSGMYSKINNIEYKNKNIFGKKLIDIIYNHFNK